MDQLWINQQESVLPTKKSGAPRPVDPDAWERAKEIEHASTALHPEQVALLHKLLEDEDLVFHSETVSVLKVARPLSGEGREKFLATVERPEIRSQVEALLQSGADVDRHGRSNIRLMSALRPTETFMLSMKLSFFAGIILSFPLLLHYTRSSSLRSPMTGGSANTFPSR